MNSEQRIEALEDTIKVLKNEINTVLLDIREHYLDLENPFNNYVMATPEPAAPADNPENETEEDIVPPVAESQPKEEAIENMEDLPHIPVSKPATEILKEHQSDASKKMDWVTVVGLTKW